MTFIRLLIFSLLFSAQYVWGDVGVSPKELSKVAQAHVNRVPEFAYIQKAAEEIGVKVYLFGGSAAAYAHYVRWYIELQNGAENHQPERFDFDYTNIYRGNQDLDLVVDGTEEQARNFQNLLREKYAHIVGDKNDWEVRLLRAPMGDKLPLLNDPDFKNQHTDTNSTGMLDLTASEREPIFRDLLDWENENSRFLQDVAAARITYLFNDKHETTSRFKQQKNPPIFSAVRYLAKLTQYEVEGLPGDIKIIRKIIAETDFQRLSPYVQKKLGEFAIKTLLNSPNSEYAWNLLDDLGLRQKLIEMDNYRTKVIESLSWWMNKEPLRSKPFGKEGRTAFEIFGEKEIIVSHETNSFLAYENITRSSRGEANAFISRKGIDGESALYGDGLYLQKGLRGARGTGLTIRFRLHPHAREKEDFTFHGNFVVVKNKSALTLIQENININIIDLFTLLKKDRINSTDRGLQEKLKRKFRRLGASSKEFQEAVEYLKDMAIFEKDFPGHYPHLKELEQVDSFNSLLKIFSDLIWSYLPSTLPAFIKNAEPSFWEENPQWVKELLKRKISLKHLLHKILHRPFWTQFPELLTPLIGIKEYDQAIIIHLLSKEHWVKNEKLVNHYIESDLSSYFIKYVLTQEHSLHRLDWLRALMQKSKNRTKIAEFILSQSRMTQYPEVFEEFLPLAKPPVIVRYLFPNHKSFFSPETVVEVYKRQPTRATILALLEHYFTQEHSIQNEKLLEEIFKTKKYDQEIVEFVLASPFWAHRADLLKKIINRADRSLRGLIVRKVFSQPHWDSEHQLLEKLINMPEKFYIHVLTHVFSQPHSRKFPDLLHKIYRKDRKSTNIINFLALPHWADQNELVQEIIESGNERQAAAIATVIFTQPHWVQHADLLKLILEKYKDSDLVVTEILRFTLSEPHLFHREDLIELALKAQGVKEKFMTAAASIFSKPDFPHPNPLLKNIAQNDPELFFYNFREKHFIYYFEELLPFLNDPERLGKNLEFLNFEFWKEQPEIVLVLVKTLLANGKPDSFYVDFFRKRLQSPFWKKHPYLLKYLDGKSVTLKNLIDKIKEEDRGLTQKELKCSTILFNK